MANDYSTGSACPAKTLSYEAPYLLYPAVPCFVGEPERPAYKTPISGAARRLAMNVRLLRVAGVISQIKPARSPCVLTTMRGVFCQGRHTQTPTLGTHKMDDSNLGKVITQPGKMYDFKVTKRFFVMTRVWKTSPIVHIIQDSTIVR